MFLYETGHNENPSKEVQITGLHSKELGIREQGAVSTVGHPNSAEASTHFEP